jgi:hypothetical protein
MLDYGFGLGRMALAEHTARFLARLERPRTIFFLNPAPGLGKLGLGHLHGSGNCQ